MVLLADARMCCWLFFWRLAVPVYSAVVCVCAGGCYYVCVAIGENRRIDVAGG